VLNASLVVSYLALRQGDAVGLFASGGERRWVAPAARHGRDRHLLRASYDLQPQPVATDYLAAATELSLRHRRRSLVMLVTNVRDEDIDDLLAAVRLLQKRHLVCVASLREARAGRRAWTRTCATCGAHARRRRRPLPGTAHRRARSAAQPPGDGAGRDLRELPGALVERYLAVKRDGLL
jgi:uncharacterized protein (DUF58 family)